MIPGRNTRFEPGLKFMTKNFHETYSQSTVEPPSERSTGLLFALGAVIIAVWWRHAGIVPWVAIGVGISLAAVSLLAPSVLKHVNLIWFQVGLLLHRVSNPLVMFAIFAVVIVPAGMLMRVWHDPLRARRAGLGQSYWIDSKTTARGTASMANQF